MRLFTWLLALLLVTVATPIAAADTASIGVRTGEHATFSRIVFDWTLPVGATVERAANGELIVRFDKPASFDLSKARVDKLSRVAAIEPAPDRLSVRIQLRGSHGYKMTDVDRKVVVDILDDAAGTPSAAPTTTKKTAQKSKQDKAQFAQNTPAASSPEDAAVPRPSAAATAESAANASPAAAAIHASSPLSIPHAENPDPRERALQPVAAASVPIGPVPDPLFDPTAWQRGKSFPDAEATLAHELIADPENAAGLLELARLLFAWRHADEAQSVVAMIKARDPKLAARADVMALADAAQLLAGRPTGSSGIFDRPGLREKPEAKLWQGAAAALGGHLGDAFKAFEAGKPRLAGYPRSFRSFLGLLAMEAAIDSKEFDAAHAYATIVADSHPEAGEAAMLTALSGLLLAKEQKPAEARALLLEAARSPVLKPQVIARLALLQLDLAAGTLSHEAAIGELEQLSYSWEGDVLQLNILDELAALLTEAKRYDEAFDTVATAKRQFPGDPRTNRMVANARDLFRTLLTGAAQDLDPIAAVALQDGHPELMPTGADAAVINRGLADRLAELDLIEPAARLYEEALRNAATADKPAIGAKLADLRLAAGDADGAIKILDATYADGAPTPAQAHRADIRAKALAESGSEMAALAAVGSGSAVNEALARADLYWRNGDWNAAANDYLRAADSEPEGDAAAAHKARLVLRATAALLLAGKRSEASAVRDKYAAVIAGSPVAPVIEKITAADAGIDVLALPEVAAEIVRID